jgi:4'-phosphopantetheinyl transferase
MDLHAAGDLGYKKNMNLTDRTSAPWLFDWQPDTDPPPLADADIMVFRVRLAAGNGDDPPDALPEWNVLADDERVRASRFVRPCDRRRFAVCRGSLRMILGRLLNRPAQSMSFRSGPGGKPELAPGSDRERRSSLRFNVTHSDELALIAVSLERELGVDVERIRTISESARIVESYFTPSELAQFRSLDPSRRDAAFLRGWTRKEAILKAKGVGLAGLATAFETMFGTTELSTRFTPAAPLPRVGDWSLWEAAAGAQYVAALAVADAVAKAVIDDLRAGRS